MRDQNRMEIWLNKALELEIRGRDFYEGVAASAKDTLVRDFFKFLADQETVHIKIIKSIYNRLDNESCWLEAKSRKAESGSLNKIFLDMTKTRPSPDSDIIQAMDHGISFETEAAAFYKNELSGAECEAEKEFLLALYGEENEHRQVLADMKLFYTNPESWAEQMDNMHLDGV